jgi:hypothetical protein
VADARKVADARTLASGYILRAKLEIHAVPEHAEPKPTKGEVQEQPKGISLRLATEKIFTGLSTQGH